MLDLPSPGDVLIVDDDPSMRDSLGAFFAAHGYEPMAFSSAEDFLANADIERAICVFVDLRMPGLGGVELHKRLAASDPALSVIILTAHGDVPIAVKSMKRGALDFLEKPASAEELLDAVEAAAKRRAARPPSSVPHSVVSERLARLTRRERQVLDHIVLGMTNKHIADELGISQRTVEIHRARIREKMEARGLSDLIGMMR